MLLFLILVDIFYQLDDFFDFCNSFLFEGGQRGLIGATSKKVALGKMALRVIKRNRYRDLEQLGLVTNCDGYLLVSLDFFRFRPTAMEI